MNKLNPLDKEIQKVLDREAQKKFEKELPKVRDLNDLIKTMSDLFNLSEELLNKKHILDVFFYTFTY